jgi:hypothetical protein
LPGLKKKKNFMKVVTSLNSLKKRELEDNMAELRS